MSCWRELGLATALVRWYEWMEEWKRDSTLSSYYLQVWGFQERFLSQIPSRKWSTINSFAFFPIHCLYSRRRGHALLLRTIIGVPDNFFTLLAIAVSGRLIVHSVHPSPQAPLCHYIDFFATPLGYLLDVGLPMPQ